MKTILESGADGVIVGSAFVKVIEENLDNQQQMLNKLGKLTKELKKGTLKP